MSRRLQVRISDTLTGLAQGVGTNGGFGYAVAVSDDGLRMAASAPFYNGGSGGIWIYHYDGTNWVYFQQILSDEGGARMGFQQDGLGFGGPSGTAGASGSYHIIVGYPDANAGKTQSGKVKIYMWNGSAYVQKGQQLDSNKHSSGGGDYHHRGESVAINQDGTKLIVGETWSNGQNGRILYYKWASTDWSKIGEVVVSTAIVLGS
jgi:hypothetical protein